MKSKRQRTRPSKSPERATGSRRTSAARRWFSRLVALFGVPALCLGAVEVALRLFGFGYATDFFIRTPVPGRTGLVENQQFSRRYFTRELKRAVQPLSFAAVKPAKTLRVFVFGESAAEGDPRPAYGFARILQVLLQERLPDREVEVINTAVTAINSHAILPIAREAARYSGDVWAIYMGNNEVVGPFGSGTVFGAQAPPRPFIRANLALKASRTGQLFDELLAGISRPGTPREWTGMEMFLKQQVRRDDRRMAAVYSHFERNLRDMVELGVRSGAKVLISTVGRNLRDCAPLASLHRANLAAGQQAEWEKLYQDGMAREQQGKHSEAVARYEQALKLDDQFAELHFRLARCHAALGDREKARGHFDLACEYDTLRFRADNRINQVIRRVAAEQSGRGVRLADAEAALQQASADGVPGEEWFYEHVHLTFPANYLVARQLAEQIFQALPLSVAAPTHSEEDRYLSLEECEQRLGFTDYDRLRMAEEMMRRTSRPPFTQQLDYAAQLARREQNVAELRERERANFAVTTAIFRQALDRRPNDWRLHDNFGGVLLDHADGSNAVVHWRRVTELLPHRLTNYDLAASVLIEQERFDEAASLCERALQIEPNYVEGLIDLGRVRLGQRRGEEAVALFQKCARLQPHAARVRNHLGLALLQLGRRTDAEAAFRFAVRLEPDFLPAKLNLGSTLLAQSKGAEAIAHYQALLRESPSNRTVRTALAKALAQNQRLGEAVEQYAEQVRQQPEDFEARYALANALLRANRLAEAGEQFAVAIRLRPDSHESRLNYGGILARQGQAQAARSQFEEALRLNPDFAPAHLNLGLVLLEDGQWPGAIAHFREALRLEPQNARARQMLESALERQKAGR